VANEALATAIKEIVARAKGGDLNGAYLGYRDLFASATFASYRVEDQRQALRLMILMKGVPAARPPAMIEAHGAAALALKELVSAHGEPSDHELLGICQVVLGDEALASTTFRAGLAIERERSPHSNLCGALMRRVSML